MHSICIANDAILRGYITVLTDGYPVEDAQVSASFCANPTTTDSFGLFELILTDKTPGERVTLRVKKEGFKVIHPKDLEVILRSNPDDYVEIFMQRIDNIVQNKNSQISSGFAVQEGEILSRSSQYDPNRRMIKTEKTWKNGETTGKEVEYFYSPYFHDSNESSLNFTERNVQQQSDIDSSTDIELQQQHEATIKPTVIYNSGKENTIDVSKSNPAQSLIQELALKNAIVNKQWNFYQLKLIPWETMLVTSIIELIEQNEQLVQQVNELKRIINSIKESSSNNKH